jgi:peptidyl-prolyl cis-trans isomerase C
MLIRQKLYISIGLCIFLIGLCPACRKDSSDKELVKVNDVSVTSDEFHRITERQSLEGKMRLLTEKDRRDFLENYVVTREVLYQEASKKGYDTRKDITDKLDDIKRAMVIEAFLEDTLSKKSDVTDAEIQRFYKDNPKLFTEPDEIKIRQIIVQSEPILQEILTKLSKGESFAKLASTYNVGKFREDSGSFGWIRRGQLSPVLTQFEEAAFSLRNKGEISDVIKTPFGYHIVQLEDKRGTALKPFGLVKEKLRSMLQEQKKQEARTAFVRDAKAKSRITINEKLWAEEEKKEPKPAQEKKTGAQPRKKMKEDR